MSKMFEEAFKHPVLSGIGCTIVAGAICKVIHCISKEIQDSKFTPEQRIQMQELRTREKEADKRDYKEAMNTMNELLKTDKEAEKEDESVQVDFEVVKEDQDGE